MTEPCTTCREVWERLARIEAVLNERDKALSLATDQFSEWKIHTNEFRAQMDRQASTFVTIDRYNEAHEGLINKHDSDIRFAVDRMNAADIQRETLRERVATIEARIEAKTGSINISYVF